jgi:hypothetical protein
MSFNIDADPDNADWTKRTWDFWGTPENQALSFLGRPEWTHDERQASRVWAFQSCPASSRKRVRRTGARLSACTGCSPSTNANVCWAGCAEARKTARGATA